ncbi:MAG: hypothetical protein K0R93_3086 [Anaerosolibacter sp.]|uniref:hypothetical protein n=1 Tax=Anaerosolibacter sp. TaxID=1872527 RepID=UPI00261990E5|nr:hypothetical protein [Anaerosolibacter sp.]MDF2548188.1 hypothetical protein [Anaerosolibacter sp.]
MSDSKNKEQDPETAEKKKVSLQDAMKQMLANKKQGKSTNKFGTDSGNTGTMKQNQVARKPNTQNRRTGGA